MDSFFLLQKSSSDIKNLNIYFIEVMKVLRKLFLLLFLFLVSIILLDEFFTTHQYVNTFKSFMVPESRISESILEDLNSDDYLKSENATYTIIRTTLMNLGYEQWLDYLSYIDLKVYKDNIMQDNNNELLVVLNLTKNSAVIAVYTSIDKEYKYVKALDGILPVQNISFIEVPHDNLKLLQVEQLIDERLGAFYIEEFIEIFLCAEDEFKSVWKKTKVLEEIYNQQWIDPQSSNDQWIKIIENNTIDILNENAVTINVIMNRKKLTAVKDTIPFEDEFSQVEELVTEENYYWSPKYQHFILFEGVVRESTQPVAVIKDTTIWKESFLGLESNNYIIKTSEGKISYIDKSFIIKP